MNLKRILELITGLHRIHHISYSYGYKLPFINVGYFNYKSHYKKFGFKKIKGRNIDYHDCSITGIY